MRITGQRPAGEVGAISAKPNVLCFRAIRHLAASVKGTSASGDAAAASVRFLVPASGTIQSAITVNSHRDHLRLTVCRLASLISHAKASPPTSRMRRTQAARSDRKMKPNNRAIQLLNFPQVIGSTCSPQSAHDARFSARQQERTLHHVALALLAQPGQRPRLYAPHSPQYNPQKATSAEFPSFDFAMPSLAFPVYPRPKSQFDP